MTQPIYSDEEVEKLVRMKRELDTKILCGIMPLVSYRNAMFIKNEMPGIHVPDEIVEQYRPDMSRAEAEAVAVDISLAVIDKLKDVADGFYFMTPFNRVELIMTALLTKWKSNHYIVEKSCRKDMISDMHFLWI